jgi:SAM-dependent methyltransferase
MSERITKEQLYSRYPWLKIRTTLEDYVEPNYYDKLLKPYSFNKKEDLEYFREFLKKLPQKLRILELGTGTGRVSQLVLNKEIENESFTGVDLSEKMIRAVSKRFSSFKDALFEQSDSLKFLETNSSHYDLVFSLWSLSHSVHQHMETLGLENGYAYAHRVLYNFINTNLNKHGHFFLIHFDALSEEQVVLRKILGRINPLYDQRGQQSLSKRVIDYSMQTLSSADVVTFKERHLLGDPIIYASIEEALEIFINFHLESHFNASAELVEVYQELRDYFTKFENDKHQIVLRPGCFIYEIEKK